MSSWLERAEAQLEQHSTALKVIEGLARLIKDALVSKDSDAYAVLQTAEHALDTLIKGFDGKVTKDEVDKLIAGLASRRAARDAEADRKLNDKFDKG